MSDSDIQNKNAASEDDLGTLHRIVTDSFRMKAGKNLKKAKKKDNPDEIQLNVLIAAGGWCRYNRTVGKSSADEELGAVVDELDAIRKKQRRNKITAVGE